MANSTHTFKERLARAFRFTLLTGVSLTLGIVATEVINDQRPLVEAETSAAMLAQRAAEHWLEDDKLALQTLVRHTESLSAVRYAAIFDAAQTPIGESGKSDYVSEAALYSAPINIAKSEVGVAVIAYEPTSTLSVWWLLALAPVVGFASLFRGEQKPKQKSTEIAELTPRVSQCYAIVALKHPPANDEWLRLSQLAERVSSYYDAEIEIGVGYFRFGLAGDDAITDTLSLARLWYGVYYAQQRKSEQHLDASVQLCLAHDFVDSDEESRWLFDIICNAANAEGVALEEAFAKHPDTTEVAVIAEHEGHYRLKKLCDRKDAVIKQQLTEILG